MAATLCSRCAERPRGAGRNTWCRECKNAWQREYRRGVKKFTPVPDPVATHDGCLIYQGAIHPKTGYGQQTYQGHFTYAHRVAWVKAHGPIPDGLTVDHLCYVPACVNVEHMELVTRAENTRRAQERRRMAGLTGICSRHGRMDRVTPKGKNYCSACMTESNERKRQRRVGSC